MTDSQIQKELEGKRNLFITGPAGTGKSYLLRKYIETHDNVLVCAPTGMAALNIGGDTMHKVFHIPVPAFESPSFAKNKKGALKESMLKPIALADTIIIDEISMARCDVFSFAIKVIRKAEKLKGSKIRIIVSGDFNQLPPVVKKTELSIMKKFKFHSSGYAFTTPEWKSCNFKVIELTDIKRQDEQVFVQELNRVRIGDFSNIEYFNQFVNEQADTADMICICGTNSEADRINQEYLDALPGPVVALQSKKEGRCSGGYIDDVILVKENCRIVFTANDIKTGRYHNGQFGTITKIHSEYVTIELDDNELINVNRQDFPIYSYSVVGNSLNKKELGVIHQFPFKIGKAVTIHKSQGQTFDKVFISPEIFAAGQLYVALSRVRNTNGLILKENLKPEYFIVDPEVEKFYKNDYVYPIKSSQSVKKSVSKSKSKTTSKAKKTQTNATKKSTTSKKKTTKASAVKKKTTTKTKKAKANTTLKKSTSRGKNKK